MALGYDVGKLSAGCLVDEGREMLVYETCSQLLFVVYIIDMTLSVFQVKVIEELVLGYLESLKSCQRFHLSGEQKLLRL